MSEHRIFFSNLGYARGISGALSHHLRYAHRHIYCPPVVQEQSLRQLKELIARENPDVCCFVEIDQGSLATGKFNQLHALTDSTYTCFDIENKYAPHSRLRSFFMTSGKSNGFMAKRALSFEKIYFTHGAKRLIYKIDLDEGLALFFAHFSLKKEVRERQILEARKLMKDVKGDVIFLGDFNILTGLGELRPLTEDASFVLLNRNDPTFTFHTRQWTLDVCVCSARLAEKARLKIIPQAFSDHAALLVDLS